jgi:hypothetical protein
MQPICNSLGDSVNLNQHHIMRALSYFFRGLLNTIKLTFYKHILVIVYNHHLVCL